MNTNRTNNRPKPTTQHMAAAAIVANRRKRINNNNMRNKIAHEKLIRICLHWWDMLVCFIQFNSCVDVLWRKVCMHAVADVKMLSVCFVLCCCCCFVFCFFAFYVYFSFIHIIMRWNGLFGCRPRRFFLQCTLHCTSLIYNHHLDARQ